jgi:hypothetical protein
MFNLVVRELATTTVVLRRRHVVLFHNVQKCEVDSFLTLPLACAPHFPVIYLIEFTRVFICVISSPYHWPCKRHICFQHDSVTGACFEVATEFTIVGHPRPTFGCIRLNWRYPRKVEVELGVLWQFVNCTVSPRRAARLHNCFFFQFVYCTMHRYLARFQSWRNVARFQSWNTRMYVRRVLFWSTLRYLWWFHSGTRADISVSFIRTRRYRWRFHSGTLSVISVSFIRTRRYLWRFRSGTHADISVSFIRTRRYLWRFHSAIHPDIFDDFILEHTQISLVISYWNTCRYIRQFNSYTQISLAVLFCHTSRYLWRFHSRTHADIFGGFISGAHPSVSFLEDTQLSRAFSFLEHAWTSRTAWFVEHAETDHAASFLGYASAARTIGYLKCTSRSVGFLEHSQTSRAADFGNMEM